MKIGIMDSGMGGLSVLYEAKKRIPNAEFLYFADIKNVPYGTKSRDEIINLTQDAVDFLVTQGIGALVIACNTATSAAVESIRKMYPKLIVIGMEPAVKMALDSDSHKKSLVIATPLTIHGKKMRELIEKYDKNHLITLKALPFLVELAEKKDFSSELVKAYLHANFKDINFNEYSSIVLGCTHFNYFKDVLKEILPEHIKILDGNSGTITHLISEIKNLNGENDISKTTYYFSKEKVNDLDEIEIFNDELDKVYNLK